MRLINKAAIKAICNKEGHSVKPAFLEAINRSIEKRVLEACHVTPGARRLDADTAVFVGFKF